jgi:hypothetical protein
MYYRILIANRTSKMKIDYAPGIIQRGIHDEEPDGAATAQTS